MIIDAHTHWGIMWEDTYGTDPSAFLAMMDTHDVDKAILFGHRGLTRNADIQKSNDVVKETCVRSNGRLVPVATVHPDYGDACLQELERCLKDLDMRGLKLHPWLQGFSTADPVVGECMKLCGKYNVPVTFHDGTPSYSMTSQIGGLALRFPQTKIVLGHSGLLALWRTAIRFGQRCENLYLVLCGPYPAAMQQIVDSVNTGRILWGSDLGFGWYDYLKNRLNLIRLLTLTEEVQENILWRNAVKLYHLYI